MRSLIRALAVAAFALALSPAFGQDASPGTLVERLTNEVLTAIRQDRDLQRGDRAKALALAEEKVLPYIDFRRMTALAIGRSWRQATPEQKDALVAEFRSLLIRTYANALGAYRGQTMVPEPVSVAPGDTEVTVRNRYLSPGRPPVKVNYEMHRTPEGWKAYDISVEGISLVATYRSTFDEAIRDAGIDGLISRMRSMNERFAGPQPAGLATAR